METLLHNLITAIGWSIVHSLWQGAIIYGLLLLIIASARLNAKARYIAAYSASALMFTSFLITFVFRFHWPVDGQTLRMTGYLLLKDFGSTPLTLVQHAEKFFPYLVSLYAIGMIIQSVIVYSGYKKISQLKRAVHLQIPETWQLVFDELVNRMSIKRVINFQLSSHVNVPMVIGYFKPLILFPMAMSTQMDMKQVEAILIHELAHIRRNDYLFNLIRTVMDTVLFFNPFIWLTGKFIDIEREHSCDDLVLNITHTPMTYAHALLKLELLTDTSAPSLAIAATGKKQYLYQRIKRITDMKTNYMNSKQKLMAITLTIATVISLAWINPAKHEGTLKSIIKKQLNFETKTVSEKKDNRRAADLIQQLTQDTTKKKVKKKMIIKGMTDSCVIFLNNNDHLDSTIHININKQLKVLKNININIDTVTSITFKHAVNGVRINGDKIHQRLLLSKQEKEDLRRMAQEMKAINKKMRIEFTPELQAKLAASTKKIQLMVASPQFKNQIQNQISSTMSNMSYMIDGAGGELEKIIELNQNPDYIALKKKFDADVKSLLEKKIQEEKENK